MNSLRNVAFKLSLAQGASGLVGGAYVPFFGAWLAWRGLSATDISTVLAIGMLLRVVAAPLSGLIADARNDRRGVMLTLNVVVLVAYASFNWPSGFYGVAVATIIGSIGLGATSPLLESVSVRLSERFGFDYGRVRLWASSIYVGGNVLSGIAVSIFGLWIIAPWLTFALIANVAASYMLPKPRTDTPRSDFSVRLRAIFAEARELLAMPVFLIFLCAAGLAQGSHAFLYGYAGLHWRALGYSGALIGVLVPIGILVEIALFSVSLRVFRLMGAPLLLIFGGLGCLFRWTILGFDPPLAFVFLAQSLHGFSFAMSHLGAMYFILKAVPPRLSATAQSLYAVASSGVFMGLGTFASGPLYSVYGGGAYFLMAAMGAGAALFALLLMRRWHGGRITTQIETEEGHDTI